MTLKTTALLALPTLALIAVVGSAARSAATEKTKADPKLAHMVFFTLKGHSAEERDAFVSSCHKYLSGHDGTDYYSVGTIAEDVTEPNVSVKDFDVALHLVFTNKAARDTYLKDPRHVKFVDENKAQFEKVRVFDSYLVPKK